MNGCKLIQSEVRNIKQKELWSEPSPTLSDVDDVLMTQAGQDAYLTADAVEISLISYLGLLYVLDGHLHRRQEDTHS